MMSILVLPSVVVYDEWSPRVPQAGVHLALLVTRAEHLRVQLEVEQKKLNLFRSETLV